MLEKIKEVPFIDESAAVKLISVDGKLKMERNDRVIWASESTELPANNISCYVEADKFFNLLPDVKTLSQDTCLNIELKNGAKYELPFLTADWQTEEMPTEYENIITFKLDDLMLCTLKNLVKPELQCIYIDARGAVSCDFVSACISDTVKANVEGFLLPPDVQELVNGRQCKVKIANDKIYIQASDFNIITSKPTIGEEPWWEQLREMLTNADHFVDVGALSTGLKRLAMFDDYISFDGDKVNAGANFEPFRFADLSAYKYEIEKVAKVLSTATEITEDNANLIFRNKSSKFLVSPMEEA